MQLPLIPSRRSRPQASLSRTGPATCPGGRIGLALLVAAAVRPAALAEAPADTARTALAAVAAEEASAGAARLTLAITEQRGLYLEGEKEAEMQKRLRAADRLEPQGSFLYGPDGWVKDLGIPAAPPSRPASHTRTAEVGGILRMLVETTVDGAGQKLGYVARAMTTAPGDAILSRRVGRSATGIEWSAAQADGDLLTLRGKRGQEEHTLVLARSPRAQVREWTLTRRLAGPSGALTEQTYRCLVTQDAGAVERIEEWVVNRPPVANIALRVTVVKKNEPVAALKPEELAVRFPKGTRVSDARFGAPVEYELTEDGIPDDQVAEAARTLAEGRVLPGHPAPGLELRDLKGRTLRLADYRDRVVVLVWFSPRFPRPETEARFADAARELEELSDRFGKRGVQFLGVSTVEPAGEKEAEELRKRFRWSFPLVTEPAGEGLRRYGAEVAVPKVAIVDRQGTLVFAQPGVDPRKIAAELDRLVPSKK